MEFYIDDGKVIIIPSGMGYIVKIVGTTYNGNIPLPDKSAIEKFIESINKVKDAGYPITSDIAANIAGSVQFEYLSDD